MKRNMMYAKHEKLAIALSCVISAICAFPYAANAMHIMEGFLPVTHAIGWTAIALPFIVAGVIKIKNILQENRRLLILLAMSGAFVFIISALKVPSVTGSSSHMTGTGLAAILFGPLVACVLGLIVLVFQALLLAHGGLTTLGANTISMAVAGPFITILLYKCGMKLKLNRGITIFVAAALGDLSAYIVTAGQLALAYPSETGGVMASFVRFLGVFAPTQAPLAVLEGVLTVLIYMALEKVAKPELEQVGLLEVRA